MTDGAAHHLDAAPPRAEAPGAAGGPAVRRLTGRRAATLALGLLIGGAGFVWVFRGHDLAQIQANLRGVDGTFVLLALLCGTIALPLRGARAALLSRSLGRLGMWTSTKAVTHSYTTNMLAPIGVGEVVRIEFLARRMGVNRASAAALVSVDRLFDTVALCVVGAAGLALISTDGAVETMLAATVCAGLAIAATLTWLGLATPGAVRRFVERAPFARLSAPLGDRLDAYAAALRLLYAPGRLTGAALLTVAIWTLNCLAMWLYALAVWGSVSPGAGIAAMTALSLGALVPSPPAQIGKYHTLFSLALASVGVPPVEAATASLVAHGADTAVFVTLGIALLSFDVAAGGRFRTREPRVGARPVSS